MKSKTLFAPLLDRGDINRIFAISERDMHSLSMSIACEVARNARVLFVDFGMTEEMRRFKYSYESGMPYIFPDNLVFSKAGEPTGNNLRDRGLFWLIYSEFTEFNNIDVIIVNDTSNIPGNAGNEVVEDDFILKVVSLAKKRKCAVFFFSGMRRKGLLCDIPILTKNKRLFDNIFMLYASYDWNPCIKQIHSKTGRYNPVFNDGFKVKYDMLRTFPHLVGY